MMTNTLTIHACQSIGVRMHQPDNANAITLEIPVGRNGQEAGSFDIVMFDLPAEVTARLLAAFPARLVIAERAEHEMA